MFGSAKFGVGEAHLDPIEKAIRAALERGNPEDAGFRQKIYRSAELALTRSLTARGGLDEQAIQARIAHLTRVSSSIETEFSPAVATVANTDVWPEPKYNDQNISPSPRAAEAEPTVKASNRLFRRLVTTLVVITILALLVMLGWTAWNSGLFGNGTDLGEGPAKVSQSENSTSADGQQVGVGNSADENWITIFEPKDASSVQASDGLTAALQGSGAGAYLSIANTTDQAQGEASFEIGKGLLETLRGKKVVFNVQAKTIDGTNTQIATSCSLAGMGECQRVRFRLEGQLTENLIIVQLADIEPEASGTLSIMPDIDKTGNPVEIIGIRVRIEQ